MPSRQKRLTRRSALGAGLALASTLLVTPPGLAAPPVPLTLPEPTGDSEVGTISLHLVDQDRQDPWKPERKRELMVDVTYPARDVESTPRADWMSDGVAKAVEKLAQEPPLNLKPGSVGWADVQQHAHLNATPDTRGGPLPVVLFSPGFASPREMNAAVIDDLASRGYVVVSMSHTYESMAVEFPDGRVVPGLNLGNDVPTMKKAIDARVADTRFVLDELARLDRGSNPDAKHRSLPRGMRSALDLSRVGMFGHSYGGYTAGESMFHDRRIDAGLDLDGALSHGFGPAQGTPYAPGQVAQHGLDRPFALFGATFLDPKTGKPAEHNHLRGGVDQSWIDFWSNQHTWKRDLTLKQAGHNSYTDFQAVLPQLGSLLPPERAEPVIGTIDPERSMAAQHAYIDAFFDLHLLGKDTKLLDRPSARFPEFKFVW